MVDKNETIYLPDDGFSARRVLSSAEVEAHVRAARGSSRDGEAKSVYTEAEILAELGVQD